jgi:hypothetical protein
MHALPKFTLENNILAGNVLMCDTYTCFRIPERERERLHARPRAQTLFGSI